MNTIKTKLNEKDYEWFGFIIVMLFMACYYLYRMFAITPWYDELYTYYMFISRGPIYAAIHWPVPNNHMGYTFLSGILMLFGNSHIALRGIAFLSSLGSLILIFILLRKITRKGMALAGVSLFASMNLVNTLAVQGRGYALTTFLFLLAFYALYCLCSQDEKEKKYYFIWIFCLWWSLYAVPSSLYFVMILCLAGGFYLLFDKKYQKLFRLIFVSAVAALLTVVTYGIVWLAIGSNLLVKNPEHAFYGMSHGAVILKHPFQSVFAGLEYMLATPYIQSVTWQQMFTEFGGWLNRLFQYFYNNSGIWLYILMGLCILLINGVWLEKKAEIHINRLFVLLIDAGYIATPLLLLVQCKMPYLRVFSYFGAVISMLFVIAADRFFANLKESLLYGFSFICVLLMVVLLTSPSYNTQYGDKEAAIEDAYKQIELAKYDTVGITDVNQEYLLKFLDSRTEGIIKEVTGSDLVLLEKNMLDKEYKEFQWEWYQSYDTIDWEYLNSSMKQIYENDYYVLYEKQK